MVDEEHITEDPAQRLVGEEDVESEGVAQDACNAQDCVGDLCGSQASL